VGLLEIAGDGLRECGLAVVVNPDNVRSPNKLNKDGALWSRRSDPGPAGPLRDYAKDLAAVRPVNLNGYAPARVPAEWRGLSGIGNNENDDGRNDAYDGEDS